MPKSSVVRFLAEWLSLVVSISVTSIVVDFACQRLGFYERSVISIPRDLFAVTGAVFVGLLAYRLYGSRQDEAD